MFKLNDYQYKFRQNGVIEVDGDALYKWLKKFGLEPYFVTNEDAKDPSRPVEFHLEIHGNRAISKRKVAKIEAELFDNWKLFGAQTQTESDTGFPVFILSSFSQFRLM